MSLTIEHPLPDAEDILLEYPVTHEHAIDRRREDVRKILDGRDKRLMMLVGPCSAWPFDAVREYADRLERLQEDVRDELLLIMRCYIQKPRTTVGWPGPLNQPNPKGPVNISEGIKQCSALIDDVARRAPLADEMLFTHNADYFVPKLSYLALGARSAEDMEHRYIASGVDVPVGIKNPTSGDIEIGVNGVLSVQAPHVFAYHQNQVRTSGNPYAHLILRGGGGSSNYDPQSIAKADLLMEKLAAEKKIVHPAIMIDASHDNSFNGHGKDPELQSFVVETVMNGIRRNREEYRHVKGFMLESFIKHGKQSEKAEEFDMGGLSITDPCLGWEQTEELIRQTADDLDRRAAR